MSIDINYSSDIFDVTNQGRFKNISEAFVTKAISYSVLITDKTIEVTASGVTVTLLDTALIGQIYVVINASSGDINITSSTTKQIGNLPSGNPTIWTQPSNSTFSFIWTGTLWRII